MKVHDYRCFGVVLNIIILFIANCSCSDSSLDSSVLKNVFGYDDRVKLNSVSYPWSTIGRLDSGCTGSLIGRRLVLTAAHCVVDSQTGRLRKNLTYFRPNYWKSIRDQPVWIESFWYGTHSPEKKRHSDWAVLKVKKPIGDIHSWLSVANMNISEKLPYTANLAGYHSDREQGTKLIVHKNCMIKKLGDGQRLLHECDATSGISGAPLIGVNDGGLRQIVALAVSEYRKGSRVSVFRDEYSDEYANVAISTSHFASVVNYLRETVDKNITPNRIENAFYQVNSNKPESEEEERPRPISPTPSPQPERCKIPKSCSIATETLATRFNSVKANAKSLVALLEGFVELGHRSNARFLVVVGRGLRRAAYNFPAYLDKMLGHSNKEMARESIATYMNKVSHEAISLDRFIKKNRTMLFDYIPPDLLKEDVANLYNLVKNLDDLIFKPG